MVETREVATLVREDGAAIELAGVASVGTHVDPVRVVRYNDAWLAEGGTARIDGEVSGGQMMLLREGSEIVVGRMTWRLRTVTQTLHREPKLEAAILDAPDDDGCWRVYRDWLMDQGDVAVRDDGPEPSTASWLEVLESKHGFVTAARVRGGFGMIPDDVESAVQAITGLPRMRFLRRLEVQPLSWVDDFDEALARAMVAFEHVAVPSLSELELGPFWEGSLPDFTRLSSVQWKLPRLRVPPRQCVKTHARAWLEVAGAERAIEQENPWRVQRGMGGWEVPWSFVTVNSRQVLAGAVYLHDGDELRAGREVAVFRAA